MGNLKEKIAQMTLEEKAGLMSGETFWLTKKVERLGVESIRVCDGPVGLRKQLTKEENGGSEETIKSVCFPSSVGTAASFDRKLMRELGEVLGEECQAEGVAIILGPAVNIKRSPLCGRNFEYVSEDPYLTTEMAAGYIEGVQSKDIGVSLKHFAVNNQENRRMVISAEVDERAMREIYLAAFEGAVRKSKPWTLMCSYNMINGTYSSENPWLLTQVLRKEWGFDGYVMSDWGAVNNRVAGVAAGLELEMPSSFGITDKKIVEAVKEGKLKEEILDQAVERLLTVHERYLSKKKSEKSYDRDKDHAVARRIASESMVLLKNNGVLPLKAGTKTAFIGKMAEAPRFQGGGSSHVNSYKVVSALEAARTTENSSISVTYAPAYQKAEDVLNLQLLEEAKRVAKEADVAVIFTGLPDTFESEGYDRKHISLPESQNQLIEEICAVQPNTIVVLHNGSPVAMPWLDKVAAVLEAYLGGEAVGEAEIDILLGRVNPSAKLAETFPLKLEDCSATPYFPGFMETVEYRESIYVGYRYYDTARKDVLFPFGFGLSYTTFEYSNLQVDLSDWEISKSMKASCYVKNTGSHTGAEVLQLYIASPCGRRFKASQELKGFEKVKLQPGQEALVEFVLEARSFAYFETDCSSWQVEAGEYTIRVGASSRDIRLEAQAVVTACGITKEGMITPPASLGEKVSLPHYDSCNLAAIPDNEFETVLCRKMSRRYRNATDEITVDNCFEDASDRKWGRRILKLIRKFSRGSSSMGDSDINYYTAIQMPIHSAAGMTGGALKEKDVDAIINLLNDRKAAGSIVHFLLAAPRIIKNMKVD